MNKNIIFCCLLMFISQIVIWFQLNGQLKWEWFKDNYLIMSLLGVPISLIWLYATKIGYDGFGALWPIRLMGFATGMISFPFLTYLLLGETITLKSIISIILAILIMIIQLV